MNQVPLVTIGIRVYNEERYLAETIESVLKQSYPNLEIIISDNRSTDNSYEIANKFALIDKRLKLIKQTVNIGAFENGKFLLQEAKGDYFMWLAAHDIITPNFITKAIALFNDEVVCVYPHASTIENGEFKEKVIHDDLESDGYLLKDRIIKACTNVKYGNAIYSLFRKESLRKSVIDINGGDLLMIILATYQGYFKCLPETCYYFRSLRPFETDEQKQKRYQSYGFHKNWLFYRTAYPFFATYKFFKIPLIEKLRIMMDIKKPLQRDIKFSWIDLFKYFLLEKKEFVLAFYILIIFIYSKYKGYDL